MPDSEWRDNDLVRYWRAGGEVTYDLGWAKLRLFGMYVHQENELGRGQYIDMGAELVHERKLSKNVTGFVSLMLGRRTWRGIPMPGEASGA